MVSEINNFSIPLTVWGKLVPTHRVSCVSLSPDLKHVVSGSHDGQLCIWDINMEEGVATPRNILMGHAEGVSSIVCGDNFVISCSINGELSRWILADGFCSKTTQSQYTHTSIRLFKMTHSQEDLLFACGYYTEVFVIDPFTLQTLYTLSSKNNCDWLSCIEVALSQDLKSDVVLGLTVRGVFKLWIIDDFSSDTHCEVQTIPLGIQNAVTMSWNSEQTHLLIVSTTKWYVFNSKYFKLIYTADSINKTNFVSGIFMDKSNLCVWSEDGKGIVYENGQAVATFSSQKVLKDPVVSYRKSCDKSIIVCGDFNENLMLWHLDRHELPVIQTTLQDHWSCKASMLEQFVEYCGVTTCLYVSELDKFFIGCEDGSLITTPAVATVMSHFFSSKYKPPEYVTMRGHQGQITCLLYPHERYSHYNKFLLVSGGSDFAVCLWDLQKYQLLQRFCVHGGEVVRILVPPEECRVRVKNSICSIASDHSVALINIKEMRCLVLASPHVFPVVTISWKPLDDFILVECCDGTVYVWQIETGHLDRVLHGLTAQEVLFACAQSEQHMAPTNICVASDLSSVRDMRRSLFQVEEDVLESPLRIVSFLTQSHAESHILLFNIESLCTQINVALKHNSVLDLEDAITMQKIYSLTQHLDWDFHKKVSAVLDKLKQEAEHLHDKFHHRHHTHETATTSAIPSSSCIVRHKCVTLQECTLALAHFLLSVLHPWGVDTQLDKAVEKLGLLRPDHPVSFGIWSRKGIFSLSLPRPQVCIQWSDSSIMAAFHTAGVMALAQVLQFHSFQDNADENSVKDIWTDLQNLNKLLFPAHNDAGLRPNIDILAKYWQNKCRALRSTVRKMLTYELHNMTSSQREQLLDTWYRYLPHFKILSKKSLLRYDVDNLDLKTVALVLFGLLGAEHAFKMESDHLHQTCTALVYLMFLPLEQRLPYTDLQTVAIDLIGKGYLVWEPYLKTYKVFTILFELCADVYKISNKNTYDQLDSVMDRSLTAHNALKTIAGVRTQTFVSYLSQEISGARENIDKTKTEVILIFDILLKEVPFVILDHLDEVVGVFLYCIDSSHLKQESLADLIPAFREFPQLHHCVHSHKIAVGLRSGVVALHDLKTGKVHTMQAHAEPVTATRISPDGKFVASYSCFENKLALWQMVAGMFGLGNVHVRCYASYDTCELEGAVHNNMGVANLEWIDKKTVKLLLIGSQQEALFHI